MGGRGPERDCARRRVRAARNIIGMPTTFAEAGHRGASFFQAHVVEPGFTCRAVSEKKKGRRFPPTLQRRWPSPMEQRGLFGQRGKHVLGSRSVAPFDLDRKHRYPACFRTTAVLSFPKVSNKARVRVAGTDRFL